MKMNYPYVEKIISTLTQNKQTISFAESCTGGRVAAAFTAISGASNILHGSVVSYSNEIKQAWLGVSEETLINYGAVSKQCVEEMLKGISNLTPNIQSDYAIAISGIAGPTGGTDEKPVGTVYIGIQTPEHTEVFHCLFEGDRTSVQEQSTQFSIEKLAYFMQLV